MKKIIGAVALASLVVGFASADVKFSLNYRTQMIGFSRLINAPNDNADENQNYWFKQGKGWQSPSDTVSVSASNDFAGVTVRIDPDAEAKSTSANGLRINQYNGYIKLGSFEVGAGNWKDGYALKQYRVVNDSDAGWYQGDLFETVKPGSLYSGAITSYVIDMANFAGGDSASSGYLTWNGDVGDAELSVTGSLIGIGSNTWDEEDSIYTGFGLRVNAKTDAFQTQFVFKTASNKTGTDKTALGEQRAFALYVMPNIEGLTLNIGGALGFNNGNVTELNADLRARKAFGSTSVTFFTNVSHITNDCGYISDVAKHLGAEGYSTNSSASNNVYFYPNDFGGSSDQTYNTHMWNMLSVRSKLTDHLSFMFTAGDLTSLRNVGTDRWTGSEIFVAPGLHLLNGKSGISTYFRFGMSHIGVKDYNKDSSENELSLLIPVVVRVRF